MENMEEDNDEQDPEFTPDTYNMSKDKRDNVRIQKGRRLEV